METAASENIGAITVADYDPDRIKQDFPILNTRVNGKALVYLDNAATAQKPRSVINAIVRHYERENANVHRGVHHLSSLATQHFEEARQRINRFLGASVGCETIFTRGATEGINLIAQCMGRARVRSGDEVLLTALEHHSNIVPWQMLCEETGAHLRVAPIDDDGVVCMDEFDRLLNERTRIVSIAHVSNALGTINPAQEICRRAREQGAISVVDGAQSAPHMPINMHDMGADFFVCSGHKMYAPTGIGVLYGRAALLEEMKPYQGGGDMILSVTFEKTLYAGLPYKFEAGTPNIEGVIGLAAAVEYLQRIGMPAIARHEEELLRYALRRLQDVPGLRLIGAPPHRAGVISFVMDHAHPHDVAQILDEEGIAVRAGHHCAQPLMRRYGLPATVRMSLGIYNTREDIDALILGLHKVRGVFS